MSTVHNYGDYRNYPERHPRYKRPHHRAHATAAVSITLPNHEKEDSLRYLDEYSCKPPPLLLIALSLSQVLQQTWLFSFSNVNILQIGVFIYESVLLSDQGHAVGPNGPVYIQVGRIILLNIQKHNTTTYTPFITMPSALLVRQTPTVLD